MPVQIKKQQFSSYDKPFNSQEELKTAIIDKFSKHGHKVKYQFSLVIR